jgi:hypothetical protein
MAIGHGAGVGHASGRAEARPALACSAAVASDGNLWLTGLDEQSRLFVQQRSLDGVLAQSRWAQRRLIDIGPDRVAADGESRPKIAFGPNGWVVIAWTQPLARPYTGEIRMVRSEDGGRSFSAPFTVHQDRQIITHRFESIAFDARGRLHVLWVDKRDAEAARKAGKPYVGAAIYRTVSDDGARSFGPDTVLAEHSCECCRIALAPAPDGGLVAMWRHVFDRNVRDHAFAPLGDLSRLPGPPARATEDLWALDACPHHGPGLTPAQVGGFHAVWFGERTGLQLVRYGRLSDSGTPSGAWRVLPDPGAEHADLASSGQRLAIVWRSFDGQATVLKAWTSEDDGVNFVQRTLARTTQDNDHPRVLAHEGRLIAVWRTSSEVFLENLV